MMDAYLLKRFGASALTLLLESVIVFVACQVLPGDPARAILGKEASTSAVDALNQQLGLDKPLPAQYWNWISQLVQGDLGRSYQYSAPVGDFLWPALEASLRLCGPDLRDLGAAAILGGVIAAFQSRQSPRPDHQRGGLVARHCPGVRIGHSAHLGVCCWAPVVACRSPSRRELPVRAALTRSSRCRTFSFVLFGYIARMARAGTVEALNSDYVRTATLKGLPRRTVVSRHVLRNSLAPTITVITTQFGELVSGLVVIEALFNYPGLGRLIYTAAQTKDFPVLLSGTLLYGVIYLWRPSLQDVLYTVLNPRLRLQGPQ